MSARRRTRRDAINCRKHLPRETPDMTGLGLPCCILRPRHVKSEAPVSRAAANRREYLPQDARHE